MFVNGKDQRTSISVNVFIFTKNVHRKRRYSFSLGVSAPNKAYETLPFVMFFIQYHGYCFLAQICYENNYLINECRYSEKSAIFT